MTKRTLFIGDVHGCYDELMELVNHIRLTPDDHLYFVGDLINKWPKSLEVVEFVRNRPNTWCVLGNHEYFSFPDEKMMQDIRDDKLILSEWSKNWIQVQKEKSKPLEEILNKNDNLNWLGSLPHIIERDEFILVHGGLHPDYGVETPREISTLIRLVDGQPWYCSYTGAKPIIYGHWAAEGLRIRANTIWLDTGCCFGGALTAYCLESREIWQVRAMRVYVDPVHWKGKSEE
jgi:diadenosine tetraphosphatase ApaH/serine/threonine PP2A family protein phosphatase